MAGENQSLLEQQTRRQDQMDDNRTFGVIDYKSNEKKSDKVYEVVEGYKYLPTGDGSRMTRLGPGQRFHPTERQVANGSLRGKARELTVSEYAALPGRKPTQVRGADIGVRRFKMAEGTLAFALEKGLGEADFESFPASGPDGRYLRADVEEMVERKASGRLPVRQPEDEDDGPDVAATDA